jgi:hypothetical protein
VLTDAHFICILFSFILRVVLHRSDEENTARVLCIFVIRISNGTVEDERFRSGFNWTSALSRKFFTRRSIKPVKFFKDLLGIVMLRL